MLNDKSTAPTHVYVLIGALALVVTIGVVTYDKIQLTTMLDNPELVRKVVASSAFRKSVEQEMSKALSAVDLQGLLAESDELQALVSHSVFDQMTGYGNTNAFQEAVVSALPEQPKIDDNSNKLNQLRSKLDLYESQLGDMATRIPRGLPARLSALCPVDDPPGDKGL